MGIEELRAAVEDEANARAASLLEDARAEVRALLEEADAARSSRREKFLGEEEAVLRGEASARVAASRSECQERVLVARQDLLDRVFERAGDRLPSLLHDPRARERMMELVEDSLRHMPPGPVVVECSDDLDEILTQALAGRHGLEVERDADMPNGFRTRSGDGTIVVDATLTKLLELARPGLAIGILRRLAGVEEVP